MKTDTKPRNKYTQAQQYLPSLKAHDKIQRNLYMKREAIFIYLPLVNRILCEHTAGDCEWTLLV